MVKETAAAVIILPLLVVVIVLGLIIEGAYRLAEPVIGSPRQRPPGF